MNCTQARPRIAAYVDQELDALECLRLDAHVSGCRACQHERTQQVFVSRELRRELVRHRAPSDLHRRIRENLLSKARRTQPWWQRLRWPALVPTAGFAAAALFSANVYMLASMPSQEDRVADGVLDSHLRALIGSRAIDVVSSDQHTVKPWYAGRLDFSPPVTDFATQGFALLGGRIDYVEGRTAAALVYQHRKHVVDVYIWPDAHSPERAPAQVARRGYNLVHWTRNGMTYWLASDLEAVELAKLEALLAATPAT
jgi:anti-sigma factor RsiW